MLKQFAVFVVLGLCAFTAKVSAEEQSEEWEARTDARLIAKKIQIYRAEYIRLRDRGTDHVNSHEAQYFQRLLWAEIREYKRKAKEENLHTTWEDDRPYNKYFSCAALGGILANIFGRMADTNVALAGADSYRAFLTQEFNCQLALGEKTVPDTFGRPESLYGEMLKRLDVAYAKLTSITNPETARTVPLDPVEREKLLWTIHIVIAGPVDDLLKYIQHSTFNTNFSDSGRFKSCRQSLSAFIQLSFIAADQLDRGQPLRADSDRTKYYRSRYAQCESLLNNPDAAQPDPGPL